MKLDRDGRYHFVLAVEEPWHSRLNPLFKTAEILGLIFGIIGLILPVFELLALGFGLLALGSLVRIKTVELDEGVGVIDEVSTEKNP